MCRNYWTYNYIFVPIIGNIIQQPFKPLKASRLNFGRWRSQPTHPPTKNLQANESTIIVTNYVFEFSTKMLGLEYVCLFPFPWQLVGVRCDMYPACILSNHLRCRWNGEWRILLRSCSVLILLLYCFDVLQLMAKCKRDVTPLLTHWSYVSFALTPWWRHQMETFSASLAVVWGIHGPPVNSPHKGLWRGSLMFSLVCAWMNGWVNNREAGDLRRYRAHYDVTVMSSTWSVSAPPYILQCK